MRLVTLFLIAAFAVSTVGAALYQKTDCTIVDPIQINNPPFGGDHSYSGPNLEPSANLSDANLMGANLTGASSNVWARSDIFSFCFRQQRVSWLY